MGKVGAFRHRLMLRTHRALALLMPFQLLSQ
jgi:hypothetical protein